MLIKMEKIHLVSLMQWPYNISAIYLLTFLSIVLATLVIVTRNPIISVLYLIALFLSISIYLIQLGLNFLGLSYLLVYIGAVSILFLFILMLINVRTSELLNNTYNSLFLSILIALSFSININQVIPDNNTYNDLENNYSDIFLKLGKQSELYLAYSDTWDNKLIDNSYIFSIGNILYTNYSILLIIASIILLLAMVGCILVTKKN